MFSIFACSTIMSNTARATVTAYLLTAVLFLVPLFAWLAGKFYRRQTEASRRIEREVIFNDQHCVVAAHPAMITEEGIKAGPNRSSAACEPPSY